MYLSQSELFFFYILFCFILFFFAFYVMFLFWPILFCGFFAVYVCFSLYIYYPGQKKRYSREIHEADLQFDHVISCNIELRFHIDATRGL